MAHETRPHGARSAFAGEGAKRKRRGGILPLLLGLLLLAIAAAILLPKLLGDDDKSDKASKPAAKEQPASPSAGQLPLANELKGRIGETVSANGVQVWKVAGQQGFWVGPTSKEAVYVEYGAKAGVAEEGAEFKPQVGDKVNLSAEVRPAPEQPGRTLHVPVADEKIIQKQGAFLNAKTVEAAS